MKNSLKRTVIDVLLFILDDKQSMAYLNDWDKKIPNLDVVEDYRTERQQIQAYRGKNVPFSFGDVSRINHSTITFSLLSL
jgi:hypothetical protein